MMINLKAALIHPNQANVMETQFGIKAPHHLSLFSESEKAFIGNRFKVASTNSAKVEKLSLHVVRYWFATYNRGRSVFPLPSLATQFWKHFGQSLTVVCSVKALLFFLSV